ncbi:MAG: hypothetical protein ACFFD7_09120, partial [Candidatus Thorarchaeota archaeon]
YESQNVSAQFSKIQQWTPEIAKVNSKTGENFEELFGLIEKHQKFLEKSGIISNYLKNRIQNETIQILKYKLTKKVIELLSSDKEIGMYINKAIEKSLDPYSMANLIIKMLGLN